MSVDHLHTSPSWFARTGDEFEPSRTDLAALIDWLALPYAGDPVFVMAGETPESDHKLRLQATWEAVVGHKGPTGPGEWAQCFTCGTWQVVASPPEEVTDHHGTDDQAAEGDHLGTDSGDPDHAGPVGRGGRLLRWARGLRRPAPR